MICSLYVRKIYFIFVVVLMCMANAQIGWAETAPNGYFTLDFDNAELRDVIKTLSDITGKNFVIDENVKGKITIYSPKRIPVKDAYQVLLAILEVEGFTAIESNNLVNVLPLSEALKKGVAVQYATAGAVPADSGEIITRMVPLQYADVNAVRKTIAPLISQTTGIVVYEASNTLILTGLPRDLKYLEEIISKLDIHQEIERVHIYHLKNVKAKSVEETLQKLTLPAGSPTQGESANPMARKGLSVIATEETNLLLITASPQDYQQIEKIIQQLDIKQQQLLLDVLIAEISFDNMSALGIEWQVSENINDKYDHKIVGGTDFGIKKGLLAGGLSGLSLGLLKGDFTNAKAILAASVERDQFNILSMPQLLTIDNHKAEINVGNQIPFLVNSRLTEQETLVRSFDYRDIGLKLAITPHINQNNYVTLDFYQEVRSLSTATVLDAPIVTVRQIQTQVTVEDKKTVVVGGLIQEDREEIEKKVPFLGDIPFFGHAFKHKSVRIKKSNLLVFITPHLITDSPVLEEISKERKDALDNFKKKE